jgi:hypothetical protein
VNFSLSNGRHTVYNLANGAGNGKIVGCHCVCCLEEKSIK